MDEHGKDGTRFHESSSYVGKVYVCICGEHFVDERDLEKHIEDETRSQMKPPKRAGQAARMRRAS